MEYVLSDFGEPVLGCLTGKRFALRRRTCDILQHPATAIWMHLVVPVTSNTLDSHQSADTWKQFIQRHCCHFVSASPVACSSDSCQSRATKRPRRNRFHSHLTDPPSLLHWLLGYWVSARSVVQPVPALCGPVLLLLPGQQALSWHQLAAQPA